MRSMKLKNNTKIKTLSILVLNAILFGCNGGGVDTTSKSENEYSISSDGTILGANGSPLLTPTGSSISVEENMLDMSGNLVAVDNAGNYFIVSQDGNISQPEFVVDRNSESLLSATGAPIENAVGSPMAVQFDGNGQPKIGVNGGIVVTQTDSQGNSVENEVLQRPDGKLWLDPLGNVATLKVIAPIDAEQASTPTVAEMAASMIGFASPRNLPNVVLSNVAATYTNSYSHTITAATKNNGYLIFGASETDYPSSIQLGLKNINVETGDVVNVSGRRGILEVGGCDFDASLANSRALTPPTSAEINSDSSLACFPSNARQLPSVRYSGLSAILTKENELWGIGYPDHGLGGVVESSLIWTTSKISLPVLWATDVKTVSGHWSTQRYNYSQIVLTNSGDVFRVARKYLTQAVIPVDSNGNQVSATDPSDVTGAFIKLTTPSDDLIINATTGWYNTIGNDIDAAIGIGISGKYYALAENTYYEFEPDVEVKNFITSSYCPLALEDINGDFNDNDKIPCMSFIGEDNKYYKILVKGFTPENQNQDETSAHLEYYYDIDDPTKTMRRLDTLTLDRVIGTGNNSILVDSDQNYYVSDKGDAKYLGVTGIGSNNIYQYARLSNNNPVVTFLRNNPTFEFSFTDSRVLIDNTNKRIAIIETEGYNGPNTGVQIYTDSPDTSTNFRGFGMVHILPTEISDKMFLD